MSIEAGISLRSRGATYSGTTAAESSLLFLLGTVLPQAVSRACFERAECGFLRSAKTKRAKSMWLITEEACTVSVLLLHSLVVSGIPREIRETGGTGEGSRSEVRGFRNFERRTSDHACLAWRARRALERLADFFSILLEFSCQPIDHYAGHFRDRFRGVL
jgi:hypothetical protein